MDFNTPALPHSAEMEQQVLGYLLYQEGAVFVAMDKITPDCFYSQAHRSIYQACLHLAKINAPVHIVSVSEALRDSGVLEDVGGRSYINCLAVGASVSDNQQDYFYQKLHDFRVRRDLIALSYQTITSCFNQESDSVLTEVQSRLMDLSTDTSGVVDYSIGELSDKAFEQLRDSFYGTHSNSIPTGFSRLDKLLNGGFKDGSLNIIAARPSMGKTTLLVNLCQHAALAQKLQVCFFTVEVDAVDLTEKFLRSIAGAVQEFNGFEPARQKLAESSLSIYDRPNLSLAGIKATLAKHKAKHGRVDLIAIDYLQLMISEGDNRVQQVTELTRGLKLLAREFDCPVICLSQLNRGVESRQDKTPMLSDLRDSGSIEQDADVVLFIYRDEYYNPESHRKGMADILIAKQRNGQTSVTVEMKFKPAISRFE